VIILENTNFIHALTRAKSLTTHLSAVNSQLLTLHARTLSTFKMMSIAFIVNFVWVLGFIMLGLWSAWTLLAVPFALYFLSGAKVSRKLEGILTKRQIMKNDDKIMSLLREKSNLMTELRELTGIADRFFTVSNMELFESFSQEGKASSFSECAALLTA
jgi:hypothetical protein